jgi:hypothetical protein
MEVKVPAKVILTGEHAVVYGRQALAAAIDLYTTIQFTCVPRVNTGLPPIAVMFEGEETSIGPSELE